MLILVDFIVVEYPRILQLDFVLILKSGMEVGDFRSRDSSSGISLQCSSKVTYESSLMRGRHEPHGIQLQIRWWQWQNVTANRQKKALLTSSSSWFKNVSVCAVLCCA